MVFYIRNKELENAILKLSQSKEFLELYIDIDGDTVLEERDITTTDYKTNTPSTTKQKVFDMNLINNQKVFLTISTSNLDVVILPSSKSDRTIIIYNKINRNTKPPCRIDARAGQTIHLDILDSKDSIKIYEGNTKNLKIFKGKNEWFDI